MKIETDFNLEKLNTFRVPARAKFFVEINSEAEIQKLFATEEFRENEKLFLGGGSNVLFTKDFEGIVILNKLEGIEIVSEDESYAIVKAMSGVVWQDLVDFAIRHNLWGIENMSYIPGSVGAGPMQNIGAYGQEIKDTLECLEAYEIKTGEKKTFLKEECGFRYRNSCFKGELKDRYFISSVTLRLSKEPRPNLEYAGLKEHLVKQGIQNPNLQEISDAVKEIRHTKLPDPREIPNAGSFFKNVLLDKSKLNKLIKDYPEMRYYPEGDKFKIPSAWLIEQTGPDQNRVSWKGYQEGKVGVHKNHSLVLINPKGGTGQEIKELASRIIDSVEQKFGITLEPEVNFV